MHYCLYGIAIAEAMAADVFADDHDS